MKRVVALICSLAIFCLFSNVAFSEEITLPYGLQFGMNLSEAIAVSGCQKSQVPEYDQCFYSDCDIPFLENCIRTEVTIGGIEAEMFALFDVSGLRQIKYHFLREDVDKERFETPGEQIAASHQAVESSLERKYGASLDATQYSHIYMPLVKNQYVFWTQRVSLFKSNYSRMSTALIPTLRIITMEDGSSIYIDNYVNARNDGIQHHELTYTYYNFSVVNEAPTSSIDF